MDFAKEGVFTLSLVGLLVAAVQVSRIFSDTVCAFLVSACINFGLFLKRFSLTIQWNLRIMDSS